MNWKILITLCAAIFFSMLGKGIVIPILPVYAHELGAAGFMVGLIFGAYSLSMSLFFPYFGRQSDFRGKKPFIVSGLLSYAVVSAGFIISKDIYSLIMLRFIQGITAAMITPVAEAYAGQITPKGKEGMIMGILGVAFVAGLGIGPLLGGVIKDRFGFEAAFAGVSIAALCGLVLSIVFLPSVKNEKIMPKENASVKYLKPHAYSKLKCRYLFRLTYTMCIGAVWAFAPLLADTEFHLSGFNVGLIITAGVFISAVLMIPMGSLADRFNKRLFILIGGLISMSAMLLFIFMQKSLDFYTVSIMLGLGDGISMPAVMAMSVVLGREKQYMGTIMALLTMTEPMGLIIGPVMAGLALDQFGLAPTFSGAAFLMFSMTMIALFLTSGFHSLENNKEVPLFSAQDRKNISSLK